MREGVVSSTEDAVITYSAENGTEEWRAPLRTNGYGRPTVANVSPAPGPEIVTSDIRGRVVVVHGNGTTAWRFGLNETGWSTPNVWQAPVVDDFDADGSPEVLIGSSSGPLRLSANGTVEWRRNGSATYMTTVQEGDGTLVPPPVLGDVDGDARPELVGVLNSGTVAILDPDTGAELALYERTVPVWTFPTVHDTDNDGAAEIFVRYGDGRVAALEYTGGDDSVTAWLGFPSGPRLASRTAGCSSMETLGTPGCRE